MLKSVLVGAGTCVLMVALAGGVMGLIDPSSLSFGSEPTEGLTAVMGSASFYCFLFGLPAALIGAAFGGAWWDSRFAGPVEEPKDP